MLVIASLEGKLFSTHLLPMSPVFTALPLPRGCIMFWAVVQRLEGHES